MRSGAAAPLSPRNRAALAPLAPKTLVEQVAEAVVQAAASGAVLPGDRVVEADIARDLRVSRVPVREALRMLESQGIVVNTPYRGMRLMEVSAARLEQTLKVRLELEKLAARELLARRRSDPSALAGLVGTVERMKDAARRGDGYGVATADTAFHRELCRASGNEVLLRVWEPLSRQLTIIFGLSTLQKDLDAIVREHVDLLEAFGRGDLRALERLMEEHILEQPTRVDYEGYAARVRG